jgi:hypothetical protein
METGLLCHGAYLDLEVVRHAALEVCGAGKKANRAVDRPLQQALDSK